MYIVLGFAAIICWLVSWYLWGGEKIRKADALEKRLTKIETTLKDMTTGRGDIKP